MASRRSIFILGLAAVMVLLPLLAGCGSTPAPTSVPSQPPVATAAPTQVPPTLAPPTQAPPTKAPATATPVPPTSTPAPAIGGALVVLLSAEPDTLDVHKSAAGVMSNIMSEVGGSLVARQPSDGQIVPYLADSWKISPDGLTWDFVLKKGIKFHDGTPLTAQAYAWTFNRAIDPATKSPGAGNQFSSLKSAEALDDQTLRLNLKQPFFPLLTNLTLRSYAGPLSKASVESKGDAYGRSPVGVGPYKFKEWQTGTRIILERNPDYNWRPQFIKDGPFIQTIEYRFIPESATGLAGLETGEIDVARDIAAKDYQRLADLKKMQLYDSFSSGCEQYVQINVTKPPFDDIRVRQALAYSVDREPLIKALATGQGVPQYGPLSRAVIGYWPGIEDQGYKLDIAKAKALLKDAGWTAGSGGVLQKDGKLLQFPLKAWQSDAYSKTAEMLKEQWKAIGADATIQQVEFASGFQDFLAGRYEICVMGYGWPDADILGIAFATGALGGADLSKAADPELDKLIAATRTTMDPAKRQEAVNQTALRLVQQVYMIGTFAAKTFLAVNNRVKGTIFSPVTNELWLIPAYITTK